MWKHHIFVHMTSNFLTPQVRSISAFQTEPCSKKDNCFLCFCTNPWTVWHPWLCQSQHQSVLAAYSHFHFACVLGFRCRWVLLQLEVASYTSLLVAGTIQPAALPSTYIVLLVVLINMRLQVSFMENPLDSMRTIWLVDLCQKCFGSRSLMQSYGQSSMQSWEIMFYAKGCFIMSSVQAYMKDSRLKKAVLRFTLWLTPQLACSWVLIWVCTHIVVHHFVA